MVFEYPKALLPISVQMFRIVSVKRSLERNEYSAVLFCVMKTQSARADQE